MTKVPYLDNCYRCGSLKEYLGEMATRLEQGRTLVSADAPREHMVGFQDGEVLVQLHLPILKERGSFTPEAKRLGFATAQACWETLGSPMGRERMAGGYYRCPSTLSNAPAE